MSSIFERIAAAKAAKAAEQAANPAPERAVTPQGKSDGPAWPLKAASPAPVAETPSASAARRPLNLRPMRPAMPAGVTVAEVPDPVMEFDANLGLDHGDLDDTDTVDDTDELEELAASLNEDDEDDVSLGESDIAGFDVSAFGIDAGSEPSPVTDNPAVVDMDRVSGPDIHAVDDHDAGPAPEPSPEPEPAKPAIIRRVIRPGTVRPAAPTEQPAPEPVATPAPAAPDVKPAAKAFSDDSPLGRLRAQSEARKAYVPLDGTPAQTAGLAAGLKAPAGHSLAPAGQRMIEEAAVEKVYSFQQYMEDWKELPEFPEDGDEVDMMEFNGARAALIERAAARIQQIFETELAGLAIQQASDFALVEISGLVKLTFVRVKEAPGAYELLDLANRALLIKGMSAMALKRQHSVANKKPKEAQAHSAALESLGFNTEEDSDGAFGGFDLSGFGA